jgi:hypothetical protein
MMILHSKKLWLIIIMGIFIGLFYFFFCNKEKPTEENQSTIEFTGVELKEEQNGKVIWKLKVDHGKVDRENNIIQLTGIDGYFIKDDNQLQIIAKEGRWEKNNKIIFLEGHVEGKTSDGGHVSAENIKYDEKIDTLSTDKPFTIEKNGRILSADSFTADRVLEEITAKGHAKLKDKEK